MSSPGFEPRATIALPQASIGAMAPEAAVNAVYAKKIAAIEDPDERREFIRDREVEYAAELNLVRLASDLLVDAVVEPEALREELIKRLQAAAGWRRRERDKHRPVTPV
jgi:acetyl-CoA carboxylase carboxyltransferase component